MRVPAAAVFALALALYLPALNNGFAYDDVAVIELDSRVHAIANVPSFFASGYWADEDLALYRPLTTSSFALDWALSGGTPAWFMFVNALWHAAASLLVFLLLARFTSIIPAVAGALVFAAHPVHVEAVANAVGRAELMAAVFMLGAMLVWPRTDAGQGRGRVAAVALLFALALLTKESAIMLPALLVLVDAARGDLVRERAGDWLRMRFMPLALLGVVAAAYLLLRAVVLGGLAPSRLDAALEVTSGPARVFTALQAWPVYLRLLFAPVTLLADYGPRIIMPVERLSSGSVFGAIILAALLLGGVMLWLRGFGAAALAALWLPVAILPVSNLIIPIGIIVAERTLYLPSVALSVVVAIGVLAISQRPQVHRIIAAAVFAVVVGLLSIRTLIRIPEWRSTDAIFAALLRDRPDSFRAHWHHARLATVSGDHARALEMYVHALELWPFRERLVLETIRAAGRAARPDYARDLAGYAVQRWPGNADAIRLRAAATLDAGDTTAARSAVAEGLRRLPGDSLLLRMDHALSQRNDP